MLNKQICEKNQTREILKKWPTFPFCFSPAVIQLSLSHDEQLCNKKEKSESKASIVFDTKLWKSSKGKKQKGKGHYFFTFTAKLRNQV